MPKITGVEISRGTKAKTITISGVTVGLTEPEIQKVTEAAAASAAGAIVDKIASVLQPDLPRIDLSLATIRNARESLSPEDPPEQLFGRQEKLEEACRRLLNGQFPIL